jgi:hypothetical protein
MLEHLVSPEFTDAYSAPVTELLSAQATTASLLAKLGSPEQVLEEDEAHAARGAFAAVTTPNASAPATTNILKLRTPQAVQHLAGMLSQYDWEFVEQAKELRGYVVAKLLEETKHPDAKIRLAALKQLGTVTEVGLYTEKIEIKKVDLTDEAIDAKIKEKLNRFMGVIDVIDTSARDEEISQLGLPNEPQ